MGPDKRTPIGLPANTPIGVRGSICADPLDCLRHTQARQANQAPPGLCLQGRGRVV